MSICKNFVGKNEDLLENDGGHSTKIREKNQDYKGRIADLPIFGRHEPAIEEKSGENSQKVAVETKQLSLVG